MTKVHMLRAQVRRRLSAAAEEIFGLFEKTIAEYEEKLCRSQQENMRQRKLLDAVYNPQLRLHKADIQELVVNKEQQQQWSSSLDQAAPHIKEEQEEHWISQEGERLQGLEEADVTRIPLTPVPVKSEDEEENPQNSLLHQRQTEQMETEADGQDYRGAEAPTMSDLDRDFQSVTTDTEWSTPSSQDSESDIEFNICKRPLKCPKCGKVFSMKQHLMSHMRAHTGEKAFTCSVCGKSFALNSCLQKHMRIHTGEKYYTCRVCEKSFTASGDLQKHMRMHAGKKAFSCSVCKKSFSTSGNLQKHMRIHKGEKPFGCSFCPKTFAQSGCLLKHVKIHTGEKPFTCSVCEKSFTLSDTLKKHMRIHTRENAPRQHRTWGFSEIEDSDDESQIHETRTEENIEVEPPASSSVEETKTETGEEDYKGPEPARNSSPARQPESDTDFKPGDSSETETEDSEDYWKETNNPRSGLKPLKNDKVPVSDSRCGAGEKPFICSECGKTYCSKGNLSRHMRIHTGEKRFVCSYCDQRFSRLLELRRHRCVSPPVRRQQTETEEKKDAEPPASDSTKQMETETGREDSGGPEPVRNLDSDRCPEPNTNDKLGDSCEPETKDGGDDDSKETKQPQSDLNSLDKSL